MTHHEGRKVRYNSLLDALARSFGLSFRIRSSSPLPQLHPFIHHLSHSRCHPEFHPPTPTVFSYTWPSQWRCTHRQLRFPSTSRNRRVISYTLVLALVALLQINQSIHRLLSLPGLTWVFQQLLLLANEYFPNVDASARTDVRCLLLSTWSNWCF